MIKVITPAIALMFAATTFTPSMAIAQENTPAEGKVERQQTKPPEDIKTANPTDTSATDGRTQQNKVDPSADASGKGTTHNPTDTSATEGRTQQDKVDPSAD